MQFLFPPKNVRRLPHTPGTWFLVSDDVSFFEGWRYRSGLNSAASGPQISVDWLMFKMAGR